MKIGNKQIGATSVFFVIEEGQANNGSFPKALAMIEAAAKTGADAIEFQLARAGDFYVKNDPGYDIYLRREFSEAQLKQLAERAKELGLSFIAVPLSHKLIAPLAQAGCSGFNINASDLTNPDILDAVVDSGLPFFLSLPLATEEEIAWAVSRVVDRGAKEFALMHGQHTMASGAGGVDAAHTSLGYIAALKRKYGVPVGFIDHTPLVWMPGCAVAAGADLVSKHLIISRKEKGPDWNVCLEPDEMSRSVADARKIKASISVGGKILAPGEKIDRSVMRRSVVAARAIAAGTVITREQLVFKRPGGGLDPSRYSELVGRIVSRNIAPDEPINLNDLKEK